MIKNVVSLNDHLAMFVYLVDLKDYAVGLSSNPYILHLNLIVIFTK